MAREPAQDRRRRADDASQRRVSGEEAGGGSGRDRLAQILENAACLVLILIVAMRPLLSETYDSSRTGISQAVQDTAALTPATTAAFDLVIWLAAGATITAAWLKRRSWHWTGLEIGWAIMAAAAVVSSWAASNKRLAINASCDWLTAIVLVMVLANLLRQRKRVILVLAVVVASGLASAAKCGTQLAWEYGDTYKLYLEHKEQFWAEQGIALTDPTVELFERRMQAREATGFLPFSNAQGSGLALAAFAALALAGISSRSRPAKAVCAAVAIVLFAMILTTGSRGAVMASLLMIIAWLILSRIEGVMLRWQRWRVIWLAGWGMVALGVVATIAMGRSGRFPDDSLRFRWEYWRITAEIIQQHPWTGVGAFNFDRAYMMHKPVEYPEEIRDPHNFIMAIVSQWGIPGGVGLLAALGMGSWVALRRWGLDATAPIDDVSRPGLEPVSIGSSGSGATGGLPASAWAARADKLPVAPNRDKLSVETPTPQAGKAKTRGSQTPTSPTATESTSTRNWIVVIAIGFILLRLWMLRSWWTAGEGGVAAAMFDLLSYGVVWVAAFAGISWLAANTAPASQGRYLLACMAGVAAFLLHNTIEFSLFVPGTLTWFAGMVAVLLAAEGREPRAGGMTRPCTAIPQNLPTMQRLATAALSFSASPRLRVSASLGCGRSPRCVISAVCLAGLLAVVAMVVVPVARCACRLDQAREAVATGLENPDRFFEAAAKADPLDPTPFTERAAWLARSGGIDDLGRALDYLREAEQRDPLDRGIQRFRSHALLRRYESTHAPADLLAAIDAAEKALHLYPDSPDAHVELARLLSLAASRLADDPQARAAGRDWRAEAAAHYRTALNLNDARPSYEIRRWSSQQRGRIAKELAELQAAATSRSAD